METKFSPNLLDNDPNFEYKPSKVIKVDSQAWFDWLSANDSFRFNAGDNSYRARKEYNIPAKTDYWYAVKKVNGKLHKKFIGKTEQLTHVRLIEISKVIMQPPHPRKTQPQETTTAPQETSNPDLMELIKSLSLRLDNLEKKHMIETAEVVDVKGFEDAIARLKDELANKDMQLTELTNQLYDKDMQLSELTNELDNANIQLTELTNQLYDKDMQLSELTNELDNANIQLTELTNQLHDKDSKPTELDNSLSTEQIIEKLGISEIIQNKGNKDFKVYVEWLEEQGIVERITNHREAIEKSLNLKIDSKKILGSLKTILEALGYETTKPSRNRVKNMINKVSSVEITSYSHFMVL